MQEDAPAPAEERFADASDARCVVELRGLLAVRPGLLEELFVVADALGYTRSGHMLPGRW